MSASATSRQFALQLVAASQHLAQRLDARLGSLRGISFAEYRLLATLADQPAARASRVELARTLGLTPSGVTRALKPMEKLGIVATVKSKRDARLAIAGLTPAGRSLVNEAATIVDETLQDLVTAVSLEHEEMRSVTQVLTKLTR